MSDSLVGLTFRPSDPDSQPVYAVLERKRGRIYFVRVDVLDRWDDLFSVEDVGRFAMNFLYVPDGFYRPPKFRLKLYVETAKEVVEESERVGKEVVLVHTYGFYARGGAVPSKSTLAGLHARFSRINEYITGLRNFKLLNYPWKVQPSDVLDAMATALTLHFADTGRGHFVEVEGLKIFVPG